MSPLGSVHRELILPNPRGFVEERSRDLIGITIGSLHLSWIELHRAADGSIRYYLGARNGSELLHTFHCLNDAHPGGSLGAVAECPVPRHRAHEFQFLRATPNEKVHYWPMRLFKGGDRAGLLLEGLSSNALRDQEVVLQLLFRRVPYWESGFLSGGYHLFLEKKIHHNDADLRRTVQRRMGEPVYHVEIRAGLFGRTSWYAHEMLLAWIRSWASDRGQTWWSFDGVGGRRHERFQAAFLNHDMTRFASPKRRRDISSTELAQVLPIPWRDNHPGLRYTGAPSLSPPRGLVPSSGSFGIQVGHASGTKVQLPSNWHHLAILGKTRSGKSTLALNVAMQILASQPQATVVVLEPTSNLIRDLVERVPIPVVEDAVEIDPSHPTYDRDGVEMTAVPLNLLHMRGRRAVEFSEFERRAERLSGDLLQAIKNAWGEESIGGRSEFILRALVQGLLAVEGTNLVDAFSALSDKKFLQRVERVACGALLKTALGRHLSKLGYDFTFSSLDKLGKIATNPLLRKTLCQRYGSVGFDQLLRHRLLLLNLAKGELGSEASTFLGSIFLTQLWSAIQEGPHSERSPTYLVVDEFHNYAIPAFADMLSEGARHGLHVVAITQYLDRIPERVRTALVGNVDTWAFFPVGAEDAKGVWEIAGGSRFGWKPEHFTGGLGLYQAAFVMSGELLKVDTLVSPKPLPDAHANRRTVLGNTRRYSRPEDSSVSPLTFSTAQVEEYLEVFPVTGGIRKEQLAEKLRWSEPQVEAATAFCVATHCVEETQDRNAAGLLLRSRGRFYREALAGARNEGEEHCGLLADAAAFLECRVPRIEIVVQEGGYLRPDAEFTWRGRTYNLEVECSTLATHVDQVVRNVRKALALGRRCLVAVEERGAAETFVGVLKKEIPGAELWDGVGLVWRDATGSMVPYEAGTRRPWGLLPGGIDEMSDEAGSAARHELAEISAVAINEPRALDVALVGQRAERLLLEGKWEVTAKDFGGILGAAISQSAERIRLGLALETLGVPKYRARRAGQEKSTYYDLRSLLDPPEPAPGASAIPPEPFRDRSDASAGWGPDSNSMVTRRQTGGQSWTDGQTYGKEGARNSNQASPPDAQAQATSKDTGDLPARGACRGSGET